MNTLKRLRLKMVSWRRHSFSTIPLFSKFYLLKLNSDIFEHLKKDITESVEGRKVPMSFYESSSSRNQRRGVMLSMIKRAALQPQPFVKVDRERRKMLFFGRISTSLFTILMLQFKGKKISNKYYFNITYNLNYLFVKLYV